MLDQIVLIELIRQRLHFVAVGKGLDEFIWVVVYSFDHAGKEHDL